MSSTTTTTTVSRRAYRSANITQLALCAPPSVDTTPTLRPVYSVQEWKVLLAINNQERELLRQLQQERSKAKQQALFGQDHLRHTNAYAVPKLYYALFYRTRKFATELKDELESGIDDTRTAWAERACALVDFSVNEVREKDVCFDQFLNSQRCSIYWILDDALLRILLWQWEDASQKLPWDISTAPLRRALDEAETLIPQWAKAEHESYHKWRNQPMDQCNTTEKFFEQSYFMLSRRFLRESLKIHEVWRAVNVGSKGKLPAELAKGIVDEVLEWEGLPTEDLRNVYFPRKKGKKVYMKGGWD